MFSSLITISRSSNFRHAMKDLCAFVSNLKIGFIHFMSSEGGLQIFHNRKKNENIISFWVLVPYLTLYPTPRKKRNRYINERVQQLHFIYYKKELYLYHSYDSIIGKARFCKCAECKPSNIYIRSNITFQHVKGKHDHTLFLNVKLP